MTELLAPQSGVTVRMYRLGHGDCFLLAFKDSPSSENEGADTPFYLLIDCGYKPGSQILKDASITDVVKQIGIACNFHIDVFVVTHEHQDHVNGLTKFKDFTIDKLWLAWTENPEDEMANQLRKRFKDTLISLVGAASKLSVSDDPAFKRLAKQVSEFIEFETENEKVKFQISRTFSAKKIKGITNKKAIKFIKDKTEKETIFLEPHGRPHNLYMGSKVRVFTLGPPRKLDLLLSLDPQDGEAFPDEAHQLDPAAAAFSAAISELTRPSVDEQFQPFARRYRISKRDITSWLKISEPSNGEELSAEDRSKMNISNFFYQNYPDNSKKDSKDWSRIDHDWLAPAEGFALRLNNEVNNTSLVLAIELPLSKKILLFSGDAQRGSWVSWDDELFGDRFGSQLNARDLLGRTVFYKVGHHGSHNATLKGTADSNYPNLNWIAQGNYADQFVAMIPANPEWAKNKSKPWMHPLPSIEKALLKKAKGRVFRADQNHKPRKRTDLGIRDPEWRKFLDLSKFNEYYHEYTILDEP